MRRRLVRSGDIARVTASALRDGGGAAVALPCVSAGPCGPVHIGRSKRLVEIGCVCWARGGVMGRSCCGREVNVGQAGSLNRPNGRLLAR